MRIGQSGISTRTCGAATGALLVVKGVMENVLVQLGQMSVSSAGIHSLIGQPETDLERSLMQSMDIPECWSPAGSLVIKQ